VELGNIEHMPLAELSQFVCELERTYAATAHRLREEERRRLNTEIGWPNESPINVLSFHADTGRDT
jgi:hypothetical protein